ncbi:MAG: hypothetical protein M3Z95_02005 [Actinomycetota bacterium]|nr:hypothetical protein [Actinomycetota bacterium]
MGDRRGRRPPVAALICCLALLSGCGGSGHARAGGLANTSASGVGESLRLDNCTDWNRATISQRRATVLALRKFAGGPVGSSAGMANGPVLSDDRAYKLFQGYCANFFARGFKLYKLYTHAAAFIGH